MKKTIIENLFPTPIYMSNIDRTFTNNTFYKGTLGSNKNLTELIL